jgi:iron complex outermembrane recepter protein
MIRTTLKTGTAIALLLSAFPAFAQDTAGEETAEDQSGIEEIVVTAQRRNEGQQDVAIAISAFTADQLAAQGVSSTFQLGQYVPNLVAINNTGLGSANGYYLRGLGNTETVATFDPPVGTYVDDIYLSRQNANNLSFLDVERVEVLRGPQGTLFGRNTTGGAISVIMRDPGDEVGGYIEAGYGRYDRKLIRGSIDLPIGDALAIKLSAYSQNDDGYTKNVTTGERINDDDGWGARLGLKLKLGETSTWRASVSHLVSKAENILNFTCNPANPTDCKGRFATTGLREGSNYSPTQYAPLLITGQKQGYGLGNSADNTIATSNFEFGLGENLTLNLITGFVNLDQNYGLDFFDGRGGPGVTAPVPAVRGFTRGGFTIVNQGSHKQFTQEVKLSGSAGDGLIDFVGGFYYYKEKNKTDFADVFSIATLPFPPFTAVPGGFGLLLADRTLRNKTTAYAGYFQADFNLSEQIKLTAGIRYTDETKTFSINDNRASCNDGTVEATCVSNQNLFVSPPSVPATIAIPRKQQAKLWTPRFAANFKANDDVLFFVSATRGFKSGGWNARGTAGSELLPFGPEKVWSYEAGVKSDLFDRRVRANLTLYFQDTTDLQTPSAFVRANGSLAFITGNFADYQNKGAELELTFRPVDDWNIYANFGYQDDKYKVNRNLPAVDQYGVRSVAAQQALCLAELAAGRVAGGPNTTNCAAGIVDAFGGIATPVRTPMWTIAMGTSYKLPLGASGWSVTPSVNASFASKSEVGTSNVSVFNGSVTGTNGTFPGNFTGVGPYVGGSFSPSHWVFNAGITLKAPDDVWSLGIECTNCLNEEYIASTLANYAYLNRPMEWMVRAKYNF